MAKQIIFKSHVKRAHGVSLDAWATGLRSITKELKAEIVDSISTPYPPASKPFKPPHTRRGSRGLMGSITVTVVPGTRGRAAAIVVKSSKDYSNHLEYGTIKMSPRPYVRPVLMSGGRRGTKLKKKWLDKIARTAKTKASKSTRSKTGNRRRR
jgi:hypothetical protein